MRRMLALTLCLMMVFAPLAARSASVEDAFLPWLSADAAIAATEETADGQTHTFAAGDGHWTLQLDAAGRALSLRSEAESAESALMSRAEAEAALKAIDATALVVRAEEGSGAAKLWFVGETAAGWGMFDPAGYLAAGSLTFGQFLTNGQLTFAGASQTLSLLRAGAQLDSMEMDEDDGMLLYEGDAWLDGQEYEFELDARTGRLLEWERD